MKIAWSGQHTRGKALSVLEQAIVKNQNCNIRVNVLGDGKLHKYYQQLAVRLGVNNKIKWHGWLPKEDARKVVAESDVFVITSLRDLTSTVLLEALSAGKPVICLDHCGFSDVVDETCGIKISIDSPHKVIKAFADAIVKLQDEKLREKLSQGAIKKAKQYLWTEKAKVLRTIYGKSGKKVLVSVYACSPYRGSEPGMGWHFLKTIAQDNEVWAIVEEEKWRSDIERYLVEHPTEMQNVHWNFIHKPRARLLRKIWPPSYYWFYRIWQWRAYKKACELHKVVGFDLVHQLNMVGFREPGYLWKMDVPFIWGPIGGLGYTDWRLLPLLGCIGAMEFAARNIINWIHAHVLIRPRHAARKAASKGRLLVATEENRNEALKLWGVESVVMCEIGVLNVNDVHNAKLAGGGMSLPGQACSRTARHCPFS